MAAGSRCGIGRGDARAGAAVAFRRNSPHSRRLRATQARARRRRFRRPSAAGDSTFARRVGAGAALQAHPHRRVSRYEPVASEADRGGDRRPREFAAGVFRRRRHQSVDLRVSARRPYGVPQLPRPGSEKRGQGCCAAREFPQPSGNPRRGPPPAARRRGFRRRAPTDCKRAASILRSPPRASISRLSLKPAKRLRSGKPAGAPPG